MRAITLWQPWASLIAIGAKTIETRSWSTAYRGPLAIHAGATLAGIAGLPGDCEGNEEGGWRYGYVGAYQASYCHRSIDGEGTRGETWMVKFDASDPDPDFDGQLPLGAVVATCELVDCAPIGGPMEFRTGIFEGDGPGRHVVIHDQIRGRLMLDDPNGRVTDISDQLPYGDFMLGRWAWLLADIRPLAEPVPCRGRQGLWDIDPAAAFGLTVEGAGQ